MAKKKTKARSTKLFLATTLTALFEGALISLLVILVPFLPHALFPGLAVPSTLVVRQELELGIAVAALGFGLTLLLVGRLFWLASLPDTLRDVLKEIPGDVNKTLGRYGLLFCPEVLVITTLFLFVFTESIGTSDLAIVVVSTAVFIHAASAVFRKTLGEAARKIDG